MLHEPSQTSAPDASAPYKMRLGVRMFVVYAVIYAAFVAINLIRPIWMENEIVFGLNLAVVYGFGLIAFALVLALIYNTMCNRHEAKIERGEKS